ncbi:MAG: ABC transporter permease subunit [Flavonifractor plautii]|nr:ABC transporter permease subunit [Flavonifractor plautii]
MWAITKREFWNLIKSVRALIIILLFSAGSIWVTNSLSKVSGQLDVEEYYASLRLLVLIFGFLFATILSHSCFNGEVETKTIRLLLTKVSKTSIVIGKMLGASLFWLVCLTGSFIFISAVGKVFHPSELFIAFSTMAYFNSIILLVSVVTAKPSRSNFVGLIFALLLPGLGLYATLTATSPLHFLQYFFPYFYLLQGVEFMGVPMIFSTLITWVAVLLVKGRDY